uniref:Ty3 transposon capsid-like protein domain-containing protein n=1 Tax=Chenopodium quinoa TaxID=63459 RepID=A0A803L3P0_CHEQI
MMEDLNAKLDEVGTKSPVSTPKSFDGGSNSTRTLGYVPKLEFPRFDGTNCRMWIKKCNKYFKLCKICDEQKVDLASLNMVDKAEVWVASYLAGKINVDWTEFVVDLTARFKDSKSDNAVENFNKLQQLGSIESYVDNFEELKSLMLQQNHGLPDSYFLASFIGGLKPAVKPFVKAFKPQTLAEAVEFARLQEESLEASKIVPKSYSSYNSKPPFPSTSTAKPSTVNSGAIVPFQPSKPSQRTHTTLIAAERREKQLKGLCYFCDQPYERNHKCPLKQTQLFLVEIPGEDDSDGEDTAEVDLSLEEELNNMDPHISMHALSGSQNFQTMRVTGFVGKKPIHILVDSGNGNHLACQHVCKDFGWSLQHTEFKSDMLLIPLGSCDMVLGVQWLSTLGTVTKNFKKMIMEFDYLGVHYVLQGEKPRKPVISVSQNAEKLFSQPAQLYFLQLASAQDYSGVYCCQTEVTSIPTVVTELLQEYTDIFAEPKCLPPSRAVFDHRIPLEFGSNPVCLSIRPYRYPLAQRDIIEKLVQEMLDQGIIQDSCS